MLVTVQGKSQDQLDEFRKGAVAEAMKTLQTHIVEATDMQIRIMTNKNLDKEDVPAMKLRFEVSKHVQALCGLNAVNKTQLSNDPENPVGVIYLPIEKMPGAV